MIFVIELDDHESRALKEVLAKQYGNNKELAELIRLAVLDANHFLSNMRMVRDQREYLANRRTRESKLRR